MMLVANVHEQAYNRPMLELRIKELEGLLLVANNSLALLTLSNTELKSDLADSQMRNKKLKRNARRDERDFKNQLTVAQNNRG